MRQRFLGNVLIKWAIHRSPALLHPIPRLPGPRQSCVSVSGAGTETVTISGGNQEGWEGVRLHPGSGKIILTVCPCQHASRCITYIYMKISSVTLNYFINLCFRDEATEARRIKWPKATKLVNGRSGSDLNLGSLAPLTPLSCCLSKDQVSERKCSLPWEDTKHPQKSSGVPSVALSHTYWSLRLEMLRVFFENPPPLADEETEDGEGLSPRSLSKQTSDL